MANDHKADFRLDLHFDSLGDFAQFVSIIRGEKLDEAALRELTARLAKSTKALQNAETHAQED